MNFPPSDHDPSDIIIHSDESENRSDELTSDTRKVIMMEGLEVAIDCSIHRIMGMTCKKKAKPMQTYSGGRPGVVSEFIYIDIASFCDIESILYSAERKHLRQDTRGRSHQSPRALNSR